MADSMAQSLLARHPLQRLESPSRGASAVLHSLGLASFAYSFSYLVLNPNPINDSYGWHFQYLTIIGLSLAAATFFFGLCADITNNSQLFQLKNAVSVASAPMACLISVLYWSLKLIDEKLVLPDWAPRLPIQTDISFHAIPAISLVVDLLFFSPPYAIAFLPALGLSGCIAFGYWFWIEQCYQHNKFYPYPLFEVLDTTQRTGLFAFSALVMAVATWCLVWLYGVVNGKDDKRERSGNINGR